MKKAMTVALLLLLFWPQLSEAEKVRFGSPAKINPVYLLPILAAEEKGYWKEQGLQVEWFAFDGGGPLWRAVAAGSIDMARTGTVATLLGIAREIPMFIVADVGGQDGFFLFVRGDSNIREPKELRGATIGLATMGGLSRPYALVVARSLGIEKEVKFLAAGGTTGLAGVIKARKIEVAVSSLGAMAPLVYTGLLRKLVDVADYLPRSWSAFVLFASKPFLSKEPATARKVVLAYLGATGFITNNRTWAVEKMKSSFGYQEEAGQGIYDTLRYKKDAKIEPAALESVRKFIMEYKLLAAGEVPPVTALYKELGD